MMPLLYGTDQVCGYFLDYSAILLTRGLSVALLLTACVYRL